MFPPEVWEEILKHGEAKDLVRLRSVSSCWDQIITKILERSDVWYKQCIKDIPKSSWTSLLEHQFNMDIAELETHITITDSPVWLKIYKSWKGWHRIVKRTPQIQTFEPLPEHRIREHVTCVATLGNTVAIGSTEGFVTFCDIVTHEVFYKTDLTEYVESVQLFRRGTLLMACGLSINGRIRFWNVREMKEEEHLRCVGSHVIASHAHCYVVRNELLRRYILLSREDPINGESLPGEDIYASPELMKVNMPGSEIVAAGADDTTLTFYTTKERRMIPTYIKAGIRFMRKKINEPDILVRYYRIFRTHVVACIGVYGEVAFSINGHGWKTYNLFQKFGAPVTTVLFHVGLLAFGLQSGEVYLFNVKHARNLRNFDFNKAESRRLMVDTEAIISLNVTEHDSVQYIVAASERHVHFVQFN